MNTKESHLLFLAADGKRSVDELLHRLTEGGALLRQIADVAGGHAGLVHQAGHLHAGIAGQVGDQPVVEHIAADFIRRVGDNGFHNV